MARLKFKTTDDIKVSKSIVNQVIGQDDAVAVIRKAAKQRRHVLLLGEPGTGKSMLGLALAELLPKEKLVDVVSFHNPNDDNNPLIRVLPGGKGRDLVQKSRGKANMSFGKSGNIFIFLALIIFSIFATWSTFNHFANDPAYGPVVGAIMAASSSIGIFFLIAAVIFIMSFGAKMGRAGGNNAGVPKVIVDNFNKKKAPFFDATGAHAGALLGDVLHDPFQSGGLGTPAHERVIGGMIHKANLGVLFIDEIATLQPHTQQELLTALQEGKYSITGQSERSAGAMVRTEAVPCNFIMIAAGNVDTIKNMHPALRSRIKGYGYDVHMSDTMKDTVENQDKVAVFVAQEIKKDKKIPPFSKSAVEEILGIARKMANRKGHLTLRFRELGGLVRAAGDVAVDKGAKLVEVIHIIEAKKIARSLEQQLADKYIERKKEYEVIKTNGEVVGRVNGLAVLGGGTNYSGIILPIEAEVTPGGKESELIATGKLGEIAKEAITNVSAIIKKYFGEDIKETYDIYVQFLQTYEGVEGDSASIAVAISVISALKKIPIKQNIAMTGSLTVRGRVLPIGGVSSKVEAAIDAGIKQVIVPKSNAPDIIVDKDRLAKINIVPVEDLKEVLKVALDWKGNEDILKGIMKK
jgi:ATP-dependent Lon protease